MLKNKKQYVLGAYHIIKYYGNDLPLFSFRKIYGKVNLSLNTVINWTRVAYTYLGDNFTICDKIKVMYIYRRITKWIVIPLKIK